MSSCVLCILPNTLYRKSLVEKISLIYNISECVIWEHPCYFTRYNFNKKKLIFHRATLKAYFDRIAKLFSKSRYISFNESFKVNKKCSLYVFDSVNIISELQGYNFHVIGTPNFLLSVQDLNFIKSQYEKRHHSSSTPPYNPFFKYNAIHFVKEINDNMEITVLNENNKKNTIHYKFFRQSFIESKKGDYNTYVNEATSYVNSLFSNNTGHVHDFIFPINHEEARLWFCREIQRISFNETFINDDIRTLFVTFDVILSSCLNVGLLNPIEIIHTMKDMTHKVSRKIFFNIKDKLLYREYKRFLYIHYRNHLTSISQSFHFNNRLTNIWYKGETAMYPVNLIIEKSLHHCMISDNEAIYVVGSYMLVKQINAEYVFKWFMEMSTDSHEWFVFFNVYAVLYQKKLMNRLLKNSTKLRMMFGFDQKFEWPKIWDEAIYAFIRKHNKNHNKS